MSNQYKVAIVGRPNVGKSALFNRMADVTASIVHSESGVTRDRLYGQVLWLGHEFTLIDTGGLDLVSRDDLVTAIKDQVYEALLEADLLIFAVDGRKGITTEDLEVAEVLRKTRKPVILAATKCDTEALDKGALEFYSLGFEKVFPLSALHGLGVGDLLDEIVSQKGEGAQDETQGATVEAEEPIRVAVVGKPNVGKSSLVNALLGDDRMTVSNMPGTTMDAVDVPFTYGGKSYVLVDTAGLRRPKSIGEKLEGLAVGRALDAVRKADVAVIMIDGTSPPTSQDRRVAGFVRRSGKASVIAVNKIDLGLWRGVMTSQYKAAALHYLRPTGYSQTVFMSCATKEGLSSVLPRVESAYTEYSRRIDTSLLNQVVGEITEFSRPPRPARFFYSVQVETKPPRMVFFVRNKSKITPMYLRYLEGEIRSRLGFQGTPIILELRERERKRRR